MHTVLVSEQHDGWSVEHDGAIDRFAAAGEAYKAGLATVDRLFDRGERAQLLMITGEGQDRSFEAFMPVGG